MTDDDGARQDRDTPAPLLLGIDAGGTMVRAVLADAAGRIAGTGQSSGANPVWMPLATVAGNVLAAVRKALAGADPGRVESAVLGVAGIGRFSRDDAAAALRRTWDRAGLRCPVHLVADPVVAFSAGTPQPRGTVLVGGTGTIAAVIDGPLVLAGSLLTAEGPIRREVQRRIAQRSGRTPVIAGDGAGGAVWLAARRLGLDPPPAVHQQLTRPDHAAGDVASGVGVADAEDVASVSDAGVRSGR